MDCFICKKAPAEAAFRVPLQRGHGLPGQAGLRERIVIEVPTCAPCLQALNARQRRCDYVMGAVVFVPAVVLSFMMGSDDGFRGYLLGFLLGAGFGMIPAVIVKIFVFARGKVYEYPPIKENLSRRWTYV